MEKTGKNAAYSRLRPYLVKEKKRSEYIAAPSKRHRPRTLSIVIVIIIGLIAA